MTATADALGRILGRIDGRGYRAYRDLRGDWGFDDGLVLTVEHVQADPFAPPSRLELHLPDRLLGYESGDLETPVARLALSDFLLRRLHDACRSSREIVCTRPGPEILERSDLRWLGRDLRVRLRVHLPARGRRVRGDQASRLFLDTLPRLLRAHLPASRIDREALQRHRCTLEDQRALREQLEERGLVAFLADGAVLPRASGVSPRPLTSAVPFSAPESCALTLETMHAGRIRGLGVPRGVTLVCGGAFHGKSTVLDALAHCVHDHVPGDGREFSVTRADATTHRAEPGRWVGGADIRTFLGPLPGGADSARFASENASGSTSQAASIVEAIEVGSQLLLLDEDTSASNLLAQDMAMRHLLEPGDEPIRHLSRRLPQLRTEWGLSTVLVLGGSGAAFASADLALQMVDFRPKDVTQRVREIAAGLGAGQDPDPLPPLPTRSWDRSSLDPAKGRRSVAIRVHAGAQASVGRHSVDLRGCGQIVDDAQVHAALRLWSRLGADAGTGRLVDDLDCLEEWLREEGLAAFRGRGPELALPRRVDLAAILSRIRGVRFQRPGGDLER